MAIQYGSVLWAYVFYSIFIKYERNKIEYPLKYKYDNYVEEKETGGNHWKFYEDKKEIKFIKRIFLIENFSFYAYLNASLISVYKLYLISQMQYLQNSDSEKFVFHSYPTLRNSLIFNLFIAASAFKYQKRMRTNMIKESPDDTKKQKNKKEKKKQNNDDGKFTQLRGILYQIKPEAITEDNGKINPATNIPDNFSKVIEFKKGNRREVVKLKRRSSIDVATDIIKNSSIVGVFNKSSVVTEFKRRNPTLSLLQIIGVFWNVIKFTIDQYLVTFIFVRKLWVTYKDQTHSERVRNEIWYWLVLYLFFWIVPTIIMTLQCRFDIKSFIKKDKKLRKEENRDENDNFLHKPLAQNASYLFGPAVIAIDLLLTKNEALHYFKQSRYNSIKVVQLFLVKYPHLFIQVYIQYALQYPEFSGVKEKFQEQPKSFPDWVPKFINFNNLIFLLIFRNVVLSSLTYASYRKTMMMIGDREKLKNKEEDKHKTDQKEFDTIKILPSSKIMLWLTYFVDYLAQCIFIGTRCLFMVFLVKSCSEHDLSTLKLGLAVLMNHVFCYQFMRHIIKERIDKAKDKIKQKKKKQRQRGGVFFQPTEVNTKNQKALFNKIDQKIIAIVNRIVYDFQSNKHVADKTFNLWDNQVLVEELEYLPIYSIMVHDVTCNLWLCLTNYFLCFLEFYYIPQSATWYIDYGMFLPNCYYLLGANLILSVTCILLYEVHVFYEGE